MGGNEIITIVGSGLMGHGIAQVFSIAGHKVNLVDVEEPNLKNALTQIQNNLSNMSAGGIKFSSSSDEI